MSHKCGCPTQAGHGCRRDVKDPGRCYRHANGPVPKRSRTHKTAKDPPSPPPLKTAVDIATELCGEQWERVVSDHLAQVFGDDLWRKLGAKWRTAYCTLLAKTAREILALKNQIHKQMGELVAGVGASLGAPPVVQECLSVLTAKISITAIDDKLTAVAHSVRMIGIYFCVARARDLQRCACFKDLAGASAKDGVRQALWQIVQTPT